MTGLNMEKASLKGFSTQRCLLCHTMSSHDTQSHATHHHNSQPVGDIAHHQGPNNTFRLYS